jgi:Domain of unknown function (DUF4386)
MNANQVGENQMTTLTNDAARLIYARVAGFTFLYYIAAGITSLALGDQSPLTDVLSLSTSFAALVLGVALYAITREQGPALALLAMMCRVIKAMHGDSAIFFAVGSLLFCWLLLRGRMIPIALAWLGVLASALLVVILPLQLAGLFGGTTNWSESVDWLIWLPMLVFEVVLSLRLLIKGVASSTVNTAPPHLDYVA